MNRFRDEPFTFCPGPAPVHEEPTELHFDYHQVTFGLSDLAIGTPLTVDEEAVLREVAKRFEQETERLIAAVFMRCSPPPIFRPANPFASDPFAT